MHKETMSPRERWLAVLNRETSDRVPMDYWATEEATENLLKYLGCDVEEMLRRQHIDKPLTIGPRYVGPPLPEGEDIWGLKWIKMDYGAGAYSEVANAPLARYNSVEEIEANYKWPSADDWDYSNLPKEIEGREDTIIRAGGCEPFLFHKYFRGEEQSYIDLVECPEIAHYCLEKQFEFSYEFTRRIFETIPGKVDLSRVAEDLGSQRGLLYSPAHIREFMIPRMKRMVDLVKQAGSHIFFHSDGSIREILPEMIEAGIDIMNPVQWRCEGMDREGLKRDFGDKVIFHGGVDNQYTLPFGTVEEVRQEVLDNYRILGAGGGYILASCHNIQSITPPENIVAMYETGYEHGWR